MFVADFLGVSNLMDAEAAAEPGSPAHCAVTIGDFTLRAGCGDTSARGAVKVVARPERVRLLAHGAAQENCLPGMVERTVYVGATLQVMVRLVTGAQLQASVTNTGVRRRLRAGRTGLRPRPGRRAARARRRGADRRPTPTPRRAEDRRRRRGAEPGRRQALTHTHLP